MQKTWMQIVWPAFLGAAAMELLIFGLFDPHDLRWFGHNLHLSDAGTYSLSFFAFWAITGACCWMTQTLGLSAADLNTDTDAPEAGH